MQKDLTSNGLCLYLKDKFSASCDFALRKIDLPCGVRVYAASIIGLCDKEYISEFVIEPLFELDDKKYLPDAVFASSLLRLEDAEKAVSSLLFGNVVIFFDLDGQNFIFATDARSKNARSISEPEGEVVIRGPREGFVESAVLNVALLRKRLVTERLCVEKTTVGYISPTEVYIVYLDGIADKKVIERIKQRLSKIDLPTVIDSAYIEHSLGDSRYPLFPDVGNSEKPDKVAA